MSLEDVSPNAGDVGGPTVRDQPELERQVAIYLTSLSAPGSTLTIGDNAAVAVGPGSTAMQVQSGDVADLLTLAPRLVGESGVAALAEALSQDGDEPGAQTRSVLERVRGGAYVVAGGMTGNAAYDGLVDLLHQVFPHFHV